MRKSTSLLLGLVVAAGCNSPSREDLDSLERRRISDVNGLTTRIIDDERRLTQAEEGLGTIRDTVNEARLGMATDLQGLALRFEEAFQAEGSERDALHALLLGELVGLERRALERYDQTSRRLDSLGQRIVANAQGQDAPVDIGTLVTGRAYIGVVLLSNGQIDPRGLQQPRAYLDQASIASAIARGYLNPHIISELNNHADRLTPFPSTSTPVDLRRASPHLVPIARTPDEARDILTTIALEGGLYSPDSSPLHSREVPVICPSDAAAVYLMVRRDLYNPQ